MYTEYLQHSPLIFMSRRPATMVTHIVLFKLSDPSTENLAATHAKLVSMQGKIAQLRHLEAGVDVIRSERSYDIALITRFDSLTALQEYQVHPYHAGEVVPHMKSVCSSIVAVDYEC
jgi:hypothetical protein